MKRIFRAWTWCVLGFGLWLGSATQVEAQGACGVGCEWCGNFRWEAVIYWHDAPLSMTCNWFSGTCDRCMLSVDASIVEADEIVEIAKASSPNELGALGRSLRRALVLERREAPTDRKRDALRPRGGWCHGSPQSGSSSGLGRAADRRLACTVKRRASDIPGICRAARCGFSPTYSSWV